MLSTVNVRLLANDQLGIFFGAVYRRRFLSLGCLSIRIFHLRVKVGGGFIGEE